MTVRSFLFEGVRQVVINHRGRGSIAIEPGPRGDAVEGSVGCADDELLQQVSLEQQGDMLEVDVPPRPLGRADVHLRFGAPAGLAYVIQGGSVDVSLTAAANRARLRVGSGEITVGQIRDLRCSAGSGDIRVAEITGDLGAYVDTGSGDIRVSSADGPLTVKSGSGDVRIMRVRGGPLRASTGSGDISVPSTSGPVDLRTATGELTIGVADDLPAWLDLHSATGGVRIALDASAEPSPGEPYVSIRARTGSGEIAVYRA